MKKRILFVDDEPMVLAGLQRMLRPMREQWDMEFTNGGAEALAAMAKAPFDAVVSDMRMPAMNGAQLLKEVSRQHPQTVRFILSGQADQELILQCVGTAHQFLSKPCEPETLKTAVGRTFAVDDLLKCDALKKIVSQLTTIPSLPSLYNQIMEQLAAPDASIETIGQTIGRDPGMTAKVLQLVNSAFFGSRRQMSNPTEAAMLLGLDTIKTLVLWIHVFSNYQQPAVRGFSMERLSDHCLSTGLLARQIVQQEDGDAKMRENAMTAGLLHDLGKLLLVVNRPALYEQALTLAEQKRIPLWQAEQEVLGTSHAEIGAYLLGLWGLPFDIVEAVALHHRPQVGGSRSFSPLTAVYAANFLQKEVTPEAGIISDPIDTAYLAEMRLDHRLPAWRELASPDRK
jgi:HD-like signal output (HDOD) protein